jgi:tetratricopeptide (TPR) repeat protein
VDYYHRLLPLLPESETGDVLVELGGVWQLTGRWAEAEQAYQRAMTVARAADRPEILAAGQRDLGDLYMYNRSYTEAVAWLRRAADGFDRLDDRAGLSRTLDRMTFALYQQGAYEEALAIADRHRTLAANDGDLAGVSIAHTYAGLVYLETGRSDEARVHLQLALDMATRSGDRRSVLLAGANLALAHSRHHEHRPALAHGRRAFEIAKEIGYRQTAAVAVGNMGEVYRDEGDYVRATQCIAYALRIAIELRDWTSVADQVANAASVAAAQGHHRDAGRLFGQAIALARDLDAPYLLCVWLHQLATLHVDQGRVDDAERLNREALDIADAQEERDIQIRAGVLAQYLQVLLGLISTEVATETTQGLTGICAEPHERALVLAAQWRLDPTADAARVAAADLYADLYERTPNVEYRDAYAFLTGASLPPGPPLPPLPEPVGDETTNIDELLRQVDQSVRHLGGTEAATAEVGGRAGSSARAEASGPLPLEACEPA